MTSSMSHLLVTSSNIGILIRNLKVKRIHVQQSGGVASRRVCQNRFVCLVPQVIDFGSRTYTNLPYIPLYERLGKGRKHFLAKRIQRLGRIIVIEGGGGGGKEGERYLKVSEYSRLSSV